MDESLDVKIDTTDPWYKVLRAIVKSENCSRNNFLAHIIWYLKMTGGSIVDRVDEKAREGFNEELKELKKAVKHDNYTTFIKTKTISFPQCCDFKRRGSRLQKVHQQVSKCEFRETYGMLYEVNDLDEDIWLDLNANQEIFTRLKTSYKMLNKGFIPFDLQGTPDDTLNALEGADMDRIKFATEILQAVVPDNSSWKELGLGSFEKIYIHRDQLLERLDARVKGSSKTISAAFGTKGELDLTKVLSATRWVNGKLNYLGLNIVSGQGRSMPNFQGSAREKREYYMIEWLPVVQFTLQNISIKSVVDKGSLMQLEIDYGDFESHASNADMAKMIEKTLRRDMRRLRRLLKKEGHDVTNLTDDEVNALIEALPREDLVADLKGRIKK
jgi:hypothetical protein